jgi:putative transposase
MKVVCRYELSTDQWNKIKDLLPGKIGDRGRTAVDNRNFVNGVLWILRSGARWSDLPAKYGKYKTVHQRFSRWAKKKIWEKIFRFLIRDKKNFYIMLDSTIVKAHAQAATFKKKTRLWGVPEEV